MTALLSIEGLEVAYGPILAVKGIDLDVGEGRLVCLIGANGAGKTTSLKAISGLLKPRAGRILFQGKDIAGRPAHRISRAGLVQVPEGRQIFAALTVTENLKMGGFHLPGSLLERRIDEAFAGFPILAERADQTAGLLSGGEQQMLALARALIADPALLLLDEPSMGLSPVMVEHLFELIGGLKRQGRTILLVEQNAELALELADDAYVLENGRIRAHGPAAEIAADHDIAAAYLGG